MPQRHATKAEVLCVASCSVAIFTILIPLAALSQVSPASNQRAVGFLPAVTYHSGGEGPVAVAVADVNRDGTPDLVVSNMCADNSCTGGSVGVLLGNGDGTFQPAMTYSSGGSYAWSVAVGDLNGDDKLDLVVANFYSDTVGVLFGNGNGTFQPAVMYRTAVSGGSNPDSVAVADVNGDGKPDLVVINSVMANFLSKTVTVLLGNGDGTFQPAIAYGSGGDIPLSVAIADVNGDGKPDVSVANFWTSFQNTHGAVGVLMANGDGTFQSPVVYLSGGTSGPNSGGSIAVADVNADDKADLLVANEGNATVGVLLGNGDGTFQPVVTYGSGGSGANSLATGDVNGDGKPDVVVATSLSATVGVLLGHGNGTFQSAVTFGSGGLNRASSVAVADVNGDARPDLLVGTCANSSCSVGAVSVLLNNTSFCTSPPVVTVVPTPISLWPPDGKKAPVTVSGTILDNPGCTVTGATYAVGDEYGQVQPTGLVNLGAGGAYSFTVLLQSARRGADLDGRLYTITVSASNDAGQIGSKNATVMVAHDLGR